MDTTLREKLLREGICIACTRTPVTATSKEYCKKCTSRFSQINSKQSNGTHRDLQSWKRRRNGAMAA